MALSRDAGDPPHLLVIDDDRRLRDLLSRYLSEQGFVVTTAADAAEAEARLTALVFDLLVMDIMMPGLSGLELTQALRARGLAVPVLLLTARDAPQDRISGLEAGADDYLPKPFEPKELLLRIRAILKRVTAAPPAPALAGAASVAGAGAAVRLGPWTFLPARGCLVGSGDPGRGEVMLTVGEVALLRQLAAAAHQVVSRSDLARPESGGAAGPDRAANERAVDVQVTRLRKKIEADPRHPRYLVTVRGEGYSLRPDP